MALSLYFVFSEVFQVLLNLQNHANTLQMYLLNLQMEATNFSQLVLEKEKCTQLLNTQLKNNSN